MKDATIYTSDLGTMMDYLEEGAERLIRGWNAHIPAIGEARKMKEAMESSNYRVWKASPEPIDNPDVVLVGAVSPSTDATVDLYTALRELKKQGLVKPDDKVFADKYVEALPGMLDQLGIEFGFHEDPEDRLLDGLKSSVDCYREAIALHADPLQERPQTGNLKDKASIVVATSEVRLEYSIIPSIMGEYGRTFQILEFFSLLSGGISRPNKESPSPEVRETREATVFRELEDVGLSYIAFMPASVGLEGPRDITLYPAGCRK